MEMEKLILIKLGGSVITDKSKPFTARPGAIKRLVGEIKQAGKIYKGKILIGHGSGSFGHTVAAKYKTQEGIDKKDSINGRPLAVFTSHIKKALEIGLIPVSVDVTGGMLHKIEESLNLAKKANRPTLIINGNKKGNLFKVILGKGVNSTVIGN